MTVYANVYPPKRRSAVPLYAAHPIDGDASGGGMDSLRLRARLEHREPSVDYDVYLSESAANDAAILRLALSLGGVAVK